jgi:hypothetical protein
LPTCPAQFGASVSPEGRVAGEEARTVRPPSAVPLGARSSDGASERLSAGSIPALTVPDLMNLFALAFAVVVVAEA